MDLWGAEGVMEPDDGVEDLEAGHVVGGEVGAMDQLVPNPCARMGGPWNPQPREARQAAGRNAIVASGHEPRRGHP
mgnify:CR=1 FL=1